VVKHPQLSVVLITRNAGRTLDAALRSIKFAGEIVVLDSGSEDRTIEISRRHGARVFTDKRPPGGFGPARNLAMSKARGQWIFFLDGDEVVTAGLRNEILHAVNDASSPEAFDMPRRNFYFGRWVRFGGRYPDRQRRLFRAGRAHYTGDLHERMVVDGRIGRFKSAIDHHPYQDSEEYFRKLGFYGHEQAKLLRKKGIKPGLWTGTRLLLLLPSSRFIRRFIFKGGFLDGSAGFLACLHDALTYIFSYASLNSVTSLRQSKNRR